ncbi:MAG: ABC transporter substrate-binding protein [Dehalococcoidia bacterium]
MTGSVPRYALALLALLLGLSLACRLAAPSPPQATFPLRVTDSRGREILIAEPPQRIIAFDAAAIETLFATGAGDRVVGTHAFVSYPPEVAHIPKVGDAFNIDLEAVAALEPDLFYIFFDRFIPEMEQLGITVLYLAAPEDLEAIYERIRLWGDIVGHTAEAEVVVKRMQRELDDLQRSLPPVVRGRGPGIRVFHEVGELWTTGPDTFVGRLYPLLKAYTIADIEGWGQLSAEQVVEANPAVIITTYPEGPQAIRDIPAFQSLSAVKAGRVYAVDGSLLSIPGPRIVEGLKELARLLWPESRYD